MQLPEVDAKQRFAGAHVLRLATADASGTPHQVPATFAVHGDSVFIAVDHKPKKHQNLKRLRNIAENDQVCVLVDVYDDDWNGLWWVRGDGTARIVDVSERAPALDLLAEKYPQYRVARPDGPVIEIAVTNWTGWAFEPR